MSPRKITPRKGRFFWQLAYTVGAFAFLVGVLAPNHYPPWVSFHNEVPVFASVALLWLTTALSRESVALRWPTILAMAAPLLLVAMQWRFGQIAFFGDALVSILYLVGAAGAWWLGMCFAARADSRVLEARLTVFSAVLLGAAIGSGAIGLLQWLELTSNLGIFGVELPSRSRASGNLAQPNLLATLLVMGSLSALYLAGRGLFPWLAYLLMAFLALALVATESRQAILAVGCASAFLMSRRRLLRAPPWKPLAVWWVSLIVLTISWAPLNEALLLRSPRELSLSVDSVRITLWQQAISSLAQSPWIGYGWRQTVVAQKFGAPFSPGEVATDYWHNIVLDLLCWVGLPMGLLVMGLVVVWATRTIVRISTSTEVWLLAFAMPVLVHSMLEFPFAYAFFLFPVAAMLGAVYAVQAPASYAMASGHRRGIGAITAAIFACVGGVLFSEYMRAEEDLRVMRFEMRNVGRTPADYARPELRLLTQMGAVLTLGRTEPARGMTTAELQRWKRANQALSWTTFHLKYIVALAVNGQEEEARRELNVLASIYGPVTYRQTLAQLIELRRTRYPDLPASFPN